MKGRGESIYHGTWFLFFFTTSLFFLFLSPSLRAITGSEWFGGGGARTEGAEEGRKKWEDYRKGGLL